jgi:hypothetical protein
MAVTAGIKKHNTPLYDELTLVVHVVNVGEQEIDVVLKGEQLYVSVHQLFDFLKIKNDSWNQSDSITGFFLHPQDLYTIDRKNHQINYQGTSYNLADGDIMRTPSGLFLKDVFFGEIFGLQCNFDFRGLSVEVSTSRNLPVIRAMQQKAMREKLDRIQGKKSADTIVSRRYPAFRYGMADWSVYAAERHDGQTDGRVNLNLGSMIVGGEATASLTITVICLFQKNNSFTAGDMLIMIMLTCASLWWGSLLPEPHPRSTTHWSALKSPTPPLYINVLSEPITSVIRLNRDG